MPGFGTFGLAALEQRDCGQRELAAFPNQLVSIRLERTKAVDREKTSWFVSNIATHYHTFEEMME